MKIGMFPCAAKPMHAGHYMVIMMAAKQCDEAHIFVSTSDRSRPGEIPILGKDMAEIWKKFIEPTLPSNTKITYGGSPVGNVYKELGQANEEKSTDTYVLYSDPTDMEINFSDTALTKYARDLFENDQIEKKSINRSDTVNVSGTKMRQYIEAGDRDSFIKNMPENINGIGVWNILYKTSKNHVSEKKSKRTQSESLVREFIKECIKM